MTNMSLLRLRLYEINFVLVRVLSRRNNLLFLIMMFRRGYCELRFLKMMFRWRYCEIRWWNCLFLLKLFEVGGKLCVLWWVNNCIIPRLFEFNMTDLGYFYGTLRYIMMLVSLVWQCRSHSWLIVLRLYIWLCYILDLVFVGVCLIQNFIRRNYRDLFLLTWILLFVCILMALFQTFWN